MILEIAFEDVTLPIVLGAVRSAAAPSILRAGRRDLRRLARSAVWWWRRAMRPLRVDPALPMDVFVRSLRTPGEAYSFDEVRRIRELCRARDRRAPHERTHGSTRLEDCLFLYLLVRAFRPRTIFEVGTLLGASASAMAHGQSESGGGVVYTVDADYGGFEPLPGHDVRCFRGERSTAALERLRREDVRVDFVFVDGTIGRRDVEILNDVGSPDLVIATHDYKPPLEKGIRNAWTIARHLDAASRSVWVLPERQGSGYALADGLSANSSIALLLPESVASRFRAGVRQA